MGTRLEASTPVPVRVVDGSLEERAAIYRETKRGFLIANYEQLLRDLDVVQTWAPDLVVRDEAQRIKNWQTRTAATIKRLTPPFRPVLTGTPFENRLDELDSLLEWIDRRPSQPKWRLAPFHEVCGENGKPTGLRNLGTLRERLAPVLLRRLRKDVLKQLPARVDTRIDVPLTVAQQEEHDARAMPIAGLLQRAKRRPLTQPEFLCLMQWLTEQRLASNGWTQLHFAETRPGIAGARPDAALLESLGMPKLAELRNLLEHVAVDPGREIVVFRQWRRALQLADGATRDALAAEGVTATLFTGELSQKRRAENIVLDVYSLVSEECIESRIAGLLARKKASFDAVFDGVNDEVRFDEQAGFLATMREVASPTPVAAIGAPAEPSLDAIEIPVEESTPGDPAPAATAGIDAQTLLAGLRVESLPDGGLRLEAPPAAAALLATLLRGMAEALDRGAAE